MIARVYILACSFALAAWSIGRASHSEATPPRASFNLFPASVGSWTGQRTTDLDPSVVGVLGVDEYVNRYYSDRDRIVHLYIGYYQTQREGSTIHSPMNCLPGAGWTPTSTGRLVIPSSSSPMTVNRVVVQKGIDRQMVLYWYQSHGRVVASEYVSKFYLVLDSMRLNRTDAALVRVIAPLRESDPQGEMSAERTASEFAGSILPLLDRFLPL